MIPVAGDTIQVALGHIRRLGELIAPLLFDILDPALQHLNGARTLGQQNGQALADIVHRGEVFQLAAELVVVALERLLLLLEVLIQLVLLREGDGIDALEHLAVGVAAPVGAAALRELDGIALDAAGGVQMRAGAQIGELTLAVEADDGVLGQVVDQLDLVGLFLLFHELDGLFAGQLKALELELFLADLAHLGFQRVQMLLGKVERRVKVVIEAVVDARPDGKLHLGIEALDRLRQHVGAGVPIGAAIGFVFKRVQIFVSHDSFSFSILGMGKKKSHP